MTLKLGNEVLTVFCPDCKCCLASTSHCGTCHTKKAIKTLCGCGNCVQRAQDYLDREEARQARMAVNLSAARAIANA